MPEMTGIELARRIRGDPRIAPLRLVLVPSTGLSEIGSDPGAIGVDAIVPKPLRQSSLLDCLGGILGSAAARSVALARPDQPLEPARRLRVLVAEDNVVNQQVALGLLRQLGHHADVVGNGLEAIEAVRTIPYDIVLMDLQMPEMDGYGATAAIRTLNGDIGRVPIVAMTANAFAEDRNRCLAAGMNDHLAKPIDRRKLHLALEHWTRPVSPDVGPEAGAVAIDNAAPDPAVADPAVADPAVIDWLIDALGEDGVGAVLEAFWSSSELLMVQMRAAHGAGDVAAIGRHAHSLKGAAGQLGLMRLTQVAAELERRCAASAVVPEDAMMRLERCSAEALAVLDERRPGS